MSSKINPPRAVGRIKIGKISSLQPLPPPRGNKGKDEAFKKKISAFYTFSDFSDDSDYPVGTERKKK
ncbi:Hypothetical protein Minf_0166 [Methylacidiphilum infernorum V4]|uniref:Uncharacterized protein n=1 Tax=Methylacidiphilum infernorum (isolate V4) TaxID=481448 RepID=B3DXJ2_METI4|nr:Hypothetical protein Minf_0166 [Methylacidiphilum infernorum V4]